MNESQIEVTNSVDGDGYILVCGHLDQRADFLASERFRSYSKLSNEISSLIATQISENWDCESEEWSDINKSEFYKVLKGVLSGNGNGFEPTYSIDKKIRPFETSAESLLDKPNHIKIAIVPVKSHTRFFGQILDKNIPFVLISPSERQCEWFSFNDQNIDCISCSKEKKCILHAEYLNSDQKNPSSHYKASLATKYGKFVFNRIPIFEMSSAVDIARWFDHYLLSKKAHKIKSMRDISNIERVSDALGTS